MAHPLLARPAPASGRARTMELGGWVMPLFGLMRHFRFLRGTRLDLFGYTDERQMERQLIKEYESVLNELVAGLSVENQETAVEIAALPQKIRGFGIVKRNNVEQAQAEQIELLRKFRGDDAGAAASIEAAA